MKAKSYNIKRVNYYVYLITNIIINKQYVGSHICYKKDPYNDKYMGSSKYVNEDIKIYGKENFTKKIITIKYVNAKDMLDGETFYILKYNTLAPNGYNRFLPNQRKGFHTGGCKSSEESKEKNRKAHAGKKDTEETRQKRINSHLGLKHSEETKYKMRINSIGKNKGKIPWNKGIIFQIKKCLYCNREMKADSNFTRYHGKNCKNKSYNYEAKII